MASEPSTPSQNDGSHISTKVREDLDKLGPDRKRRILDVADRDRSDKQPR